MRKLLASVLLCAVPVLLSGCGDSETAGQSGRATSVNGGAPRAIAPLPPGNHDVQGRVVTVRLPYRTADNLLWVGASDEMEEAPFMFQTLDIEPGAGPAGTDLAVFIYKADKPGSATLTFGLVPPGKTLVGSAATRFKGEPASRYSATVTVQ